MRWRMRNEGTARRTRVRHASDLRPRGRTGAREEDAGGRLRMQVRKRSGGFPSEAPGHAEDGHVPRPGQVFGLMDGRTECAGLLPAASRPMGQCCWRGSFPNTAAGQRRNWPMEQAAPASLLIPSLYPNKAMKTLADERYAPARRRVKQYCRGCLIPSVAVLSLARPGTPGSRRSGRMARSADGIDSPSVRSFAEGQAWAGSSDDVMKRRFNLRFRPTPRKARRSDPDAPPAAQCAEIG